MAHGPQVVGALLATVLALTAAACSSSSPPSGAGATADPASRGVDTHEIEQLLVAKQKAQSPDFDVRDPSCPARIVVAEGETFQCTVIVEGVVVPYQVILRDVNQNSKTAGYDLRPAKSILSIPKLVNALQQNSPGSRIDCGPERVKVLDEGGTFQCTVTDAGGASLPVTLRVKDRDGNVEQVANP
jgi:hypothetical protein